MSASLWAFESDCVRRFAPDADGKALLYCGVDEAGRGCLAGPVVAAAVILPAGLALPGLNDSKKLTPKKREALYVAICRKALAFAIAQATVSEIESLNILEAAQLAMRRAVEALTPKPALALIDGPFARGFSCETLPIVGGDGKCASIAAASILAKVARDHLMQDLDARYPDYAFAQHKGYGTALHYARLTRHGPSLLHRRLFLRKFNARVSGPSEAFTPLEKML